MSITCVYVFYVHIYIGEIHTCSNGIKLKIITCNPSTTCHEGLDSLIINKLVHYSLSFKFAY